MQNTNDPNLNSRPFHWMPHSLRTRLVLWNSVIVAGILVVFGAILSSIIRTHLENMLEREMRMRAEPFQRRGSFGGHDNPPWRTGRSRNEDNPRSPDGKERENPPGFSGWERGFRPTNGANDKGQPPHRSEPGTHFPENEPRPPEGFGRGFRNRYPPYVMDEKGKRVAPHPNDSPWDASVLGKIEDGKPLFTIVRFEGEPYKVLTFRHINPNNETNIVQMAAPLEGIIQAVNGVNQTLLLLLPFALAASGLGGYFLTRQALRPVEQINQTAQQISVQNLSKRLPVIGQDEFSRLSVTINAMLSRLQTAFDEQAKTLELQKRFTADASHELKTPLAIIKANTSMVLNTPSDTEDYVTALKEVDSAAGTMTKLVQDLLLLSRADAGQLAIQRNPLQIEELLRQAMVRVAYRGGAEIHLHTAHPEIKVMGAAEELVQVFTNLLDNARRHTPHEGSIDIRVEQTDNQAVITIEDTGCGIPTEHLTHLGKRFYRVDASRNRAEGGTGLGLSICKSILTAHGGTLEIASTVGKGTKVTVKLNKEN